MHHQEIAHALDPRAGDGDLAIVRSGQQKRADRIEGTISGDDAQREAHRPEPARQIIRAGAQLLAAGAGREFVEKVALVLDAR